MALRGSSLRWLGPLAICVAGFAFAMTLYVSTWPSPAPRPGSGLPPDAEQVFVRDVVPSDRQEGQVIVLQALERPVVVPVVVSVSEGTQVRDARLGEAKDSALLQAIVGSFGGHIGAALLSLEEGELAGRLVLFHRGEVRVLASSPGQAIAVATGASRPIFVTLEAMTESGLSTEDMEKLIDLADHASDTPQVAL